MAGLWANDPETPEGKYPIVLRRDGTALATPYIVMTLRDPCAPATFRAYADEAERQGLDPQYVADFRELARKAETVRKRIGAGDPDAPRHRKDDPIVLAWARSLHNPSQ